MVDKKVTIQGTKRELMQVIPQLTAMYQLLEGLETDSNNTNENFDPGRKYHPLVRLYFKQDSDFVAGTNQLKGRGRNRKVGEVTFRLMDETTETITEANLKTLGQRIKQVFGEGEGYVWNKGKELYTYADWSRGYQMQMLCRSEAQARDLAIKVLSLQGHTPIWKYMTKGKNVAGEERFPIERQTKVILGEQVELPLQRPNVDVRFKLADVRVNPLYKWVTIYDKTGKRTSALVR